MRAKVLTINLEGEGCFLGMEKGCFVVRDKQGKAERIPLFENEIGEIVLTSGNCISTGVLASCGFWDIPIIVKTKMGNPVAVLRSLDDDSHVKTRLAQYEALNNGKGLEIAKQIVLSKVKSQNMLLQKYSLRQLDLTRFRAKIDGFRFNSLKELRYRLNQLEGRASEHYFRQILKLMPDSIRVESRRTWKAYDGVNNTFNFAYAFLKFKVYSAVSRAHLEPYLGFLHSEHFNKPSLVCDLMELYRYLVDDVVVGFCMSLSAKDFVVKSELRSERRIGKRQVLSREKTKALTERLNLLFEARVDIPRIVHGKSQTLDTLINEEALLLAKYLRSEKQEWKPRLPSLS